MLTKEEYQTPPDCKKCEGVKCNTAGWYAKRILTGEEAQEEMVEVGEAVQKQCSWKKAIISRQKHWLENPYFDTALKLKEMSDYGLPPKGLKNDKQQEEFQEALLVLTQTLSNPKDLDGFLIIEGKTNAGKSTMAHIVARKFNDEGLYPKLVSIIDLALETSELQRGSKVFDKDQKVIYDINDWCKADLLVIDHFDMVNEYFKFADIRRANLLKIFKTRLKESLPTIILSQREMRDIFSDEALSSGAPADLPRFINKNETRIVLHGRFQKHVKTHEVEKEKRGERTVKKVRKVRPKLK